MTDHMVLAAKAQPKEWEGAKSAKFTTVKKHLPPPQPNRDGPHPLFNMGGRKHYEGKRAPEWEFKAQRTRITPIDHEAEQ